MAKKVKSLISKFDIGGQLLHKMGLPDPLGDMTGLGPGAIAREKAMAEAAQAGSVAAPAASPTAVSDETLAAREAQRKRQLASAGMGGTVLTSASGISASASTAGKSLLGS